MRLLAAACLLCVVTLASACTYYNDETHLFYDLTPLSGTTYNFTSSSGYVWELSLCGDGTACGAGVSACQMDPQGNIFDAGATAAQAFSPFLDDITKNGVSLSYFDGGVCANNNVARSTRVNIACDPSVASLVVDDAEEPLTCVYVIHGRSSYGCGME